MADKITIENVYGVHGTCYSIKRVAGKQYEVDVPLGCHIARYDLSNQKQPRIATFKCHESTISDIQSHCVKLDKNANNPIELTATCSYDGTLRIWDDKYQQLCTVGCGDNHPISRVEFIGL